MELNSSIEHLSSKALRAIPRTLGEINNIKKEVSLLKEKIDNFNDNLSVMEDSSENSIQFLSQLDQLKSKMEKCMVSVEQADTYAAMMQEVEQLLKSSELERTARLILQLEQSTEVLKSIPRFKNSAKQLQGYKENFESVLRPKLINSVKEYDVQSIRLLFNLFRQIGKEESLFPLYFGSRTVSLDSILSSSEPNLSTVLDQYYTRFSELFTKEVEWTNQLFSSSSDRLDFLFALLKYEAERAGKSLSDRIEKFLTSLSQENRLRKLIDLYKKCVQFVSDLEGILRTEVKTTEHKKQLLHSSKIVLLPFVGYQKRFGNLEKQFLNFQLENLLPVCFKKNSFLWFLHLFFSFLKGQG